MEEKFSISLSAAASLFTFDVLCYLLSSLSLSFFFCLCYLYAGAAAVVVLLSHPDQIQDVIFGDEGVIKGYSPSFFTSQFLNFISGLLSKRLYAIASSLVRSTEGHCFAFVFHNTAFAPPEARETTCRLLQIWLLLRHRLHFISVF